MLHQVCLTQSFNFSSVCNRCPGKHRGCVQYLWALSHSVFCLVDDLSPLQFTHLATTVDLFSALDYLWSFTCTASYNEEFHKSVICMKNKLLLLAVKLAYSGPRWLHPIRQWKSTFSLTPAHSWFYGPP